MALCGMPLAGVDSNHCREPRNIVTGGSPRGAGRDVTRVCPLDGNDEDASWQWENLAQRFLSSGQTPVIVSGSLRVIAAGSTLWRCET